MTSENTVLLLYPYADQQLAGQSIKEALQAQGTQVEELVMVDQYAQVLDWLQMPVTAVVVS